MTPIPDKLMFRLSDVASILGVHIDTIRRWILEGKLKTIRTFGGHYRIPLEEVIRMVAERRENHLMQP